MNENASSSSTAVTTADGTAPASGEDRTRTTAPGTAATPTAMADSATQPAEGVTRRERLRLMRPPGFAPLAPLGGWLAAWGAASVAAHALASAGVPLGMGFGIANGNGSVEDGFFPGLWFVVVQFGAFLIGGYVAARMARNRGLAHAALAWVLAMLATGADAIAQSMRALASSVLAPMGVPWWTDTGLQGGWRLWVALAIPAIAALVGAIFGGGIGAAANRAAVVVVETPRERLPRHGGLGAPPA
jgi:hypothetical protein